MAFTQKDRLEVDSLTEEFLCSNLSNWLDLDQIVEVAFEVQKNRKNNREDKLKHKKRSQKRQ